MSDISVNMANPANSVNFGRRKHRNHNKQQCQNCNNQQSPFGAFVKFVAGAGGGYLAKKTLLTEPTADQVVLQMQKTELGEQYKAISSVNGIVEGLKKEDAALTDANKEVLKKLGIEIPAEQSPLDFLKAKVKEMTMSAESSDRGAIKKKMGLLDTFLKIEKTMEETPADKRTGKIFEAMETMVDGMKKTIAKAFHLDVDKDGKSVADFDAKAMKETLKEQNKKLTDAMIAKKEEVADKLKNIKLLDADDAVAKAYKAVKGSKMLPGIAGIAVAAYALKSLFFPSNNKSSRRAA